MKRKFNVGDKVMSRTVLDMYEAATVVSYDGHGYYYVKPETSSRERCLPRGRYLAHATNLRRRNPDGAEGIFKA